jgi:hypothetical protein
VKPLANIGKEEAAPLSASEVDDMIKTLYRYSRRLGGVNLTLTRSLSSTNIPCLPLADACDHLRKIRDILIVLEWKRLRGK